MSIESLLRARGWRLGHDVSGERYWEQDGQWATRYAQQSAVQQALADDDRRLAEATALLERCRRYIGHNPNGAGEKLVRDIETHLSRAPAQPAAPKVIDLGKALRDSLRQPAAPYPQPGEIEQPAAPEPSACCEGRAALVSRLMRAEDRVIAAQQVGIDALKRAESAEAQLAELQNDVARETARALEAEKQCGLHNAACDRNWDRWHSAESQLAALRRILELAPSIDPDGEGATLGELDTTVYVVCRLRALLSPPSPSAVPGEKL